MFFLQSCGEKALFEVEKELIESWSYDQALTLDIDVQDATKVYDLDLFIDHDRSYSFQNLYVTVETVFPDGKKTNSTIPINLSDKRGNMYGKCNSEKCQLRVFLVQAFKFKDAGKYKITVTQDSREEQLTGINKLRLALFTKE